MTTKAIIEELNCKKEEAPQKSLEKAFEILKTNPDVQAHIKNMVVAAIHVNGGYKALSVSLDFVDVGLVSGDPIERLRKGLEALTDLFIKHMKEIDKEEADKKEENHD